MNHFLYFLLSLLLLGFSLALAQKGASLELDRNGNAIQVQQSASSQEGGRFAPSSGQCEEGARIGTVYAPSPTTVETFINQTRILSNIALIRTPTESSEEKAARQARNEPTQEKLSLIAGAMDFNEDKLCPGQITHGGEITLFEGRTTITGSSFTYHNATGQGEMEGPINLERENTDTAAGLVASSKRLTFDVDNDLTILKGGVKLEAEGRVSEADSVEFDEQNSIATLKGNPARSEQGTEIVQGSIIQYYLDSNDVVVTRGVRATFEIDDLQ